MATDKHDKVPKDTREAEGKEKEGRRATTGSWSQEKRRKSLTRSDRRKLSAEDAYQLLLSKATRTSEFYTGVFNLAENVCHV